MKLIAQRTIRLYQLVISPFFGCCCRFEPSCSHYTSEAIAHYGLVKGGWLGFKRICRCQPFCAGGYDPLPNKNN